jgi:hypothetical protein
MITITAMTRAVAAITTMKRAVVATITTMKRAGVAITTTMKRAVLAKIMWSTAVPRKAK